MTTLNHVENDTIVMLQEVMEDGFEPLIQSYLDDSQERMKELQQALSEEDGDQLRRVAHSLKGSSGNVGAAQLAGLCHRVESLGKQDVIEGVAELLVQIEEEFEQVSAIMNGFIH